jgi:hypothetical protein
LIDIGDGENWVGDDEDGHNLVDIPDNLRSESVASMIDWAWPGLRNSQTDGVLDQRFCAEETRSGTPLTTRFSSFSPGRRSCAPPRTHFWERTQGWPSRANTSTVRRPTGCPCTS